MSDDYLIAKFPENQQRLKKWAREFKLTHPTTKEESIMKAPYSFVVIDDIAIAPGAMTRAVLYNLDQFIGEFDDKLQEMFKEWRLQKPEDQVPIRIVETIHDIAEVWNDYNSDVRLFVTPTKGYFWNPEETLHLKVWVVK